MRAKLVNGVVSVLLLLALLLPGLPASAADPAPANPATGADDQVKVVGRVTLITGDVVTVAAGADGKRSFAISPADPNKLGQNFLTFEQNGQTYIIPSGINLKKLDMELFNIDYLVDAGYGKEPSLPLMVTYSPQLTVPQVQSLEGKVTALGQETRPLKEVQTLATRLAYTGIDAAYANLVSQPDVAKIWLDRKVRAELVNSVPLVGAQSWWNAGYKGEGQKIAILDTGIDSSHPALDDMDDSANTTDPKVVVNVNFSDDVDYKDRYGHGTHVAGIAAGTAANSTYTGVAPGSKLWNVKVLNQYGYGYYSGIINGVDFASLGADGIAGTGDEANVINMSIGGGGASDGTDPLSKAVNLAVERGVTVVIAAGNSGYAGLGGINVPGVAQKAITVGASTKQDTLAYFSSRGPTIDGRIKPDILAPGEYITSSIPGGLYQSWSGTSMATPHVTGAVALLRQNMGDNVTPQRIKDRLMFTAKDLGLNVYEQGAGRLDLTREQRAKVGVTPASRSLGTFIGKSSASGNFTFNNTDNVSHVFTLSANLTDVTGGRDYSGNVAFPGYPNGFTLPAGGSVNITLDVNLTTLPASLFSGKIVATIDGGASRSIRAIFGFTKAWEVTILKKDIDGMPAKGHPLWVMMASPREQMLFSWEETDQSGNFTFPAFDGTYQVVSPNWGREKDKLTVWTVAENVTISANTTINLDERQTKVVDFNPNKPDMKVAGQVSRLFYSSSSSYGWGITWYYPTSFATRVSPIKRFDTGFAYVYYPQSDFLPNDPSLVNTGEWHNLLFPVDNVTDNIILSADYSKLVHRDSGYGMALQKERVGWYQVAWGPGLWNWEVGFGYDMTAPQRHWEWLMPQPTEYYQELSGYTQNAEWYFHQNNWVSYPAGDARWGIGIHPFTSGANVGYISWNVPPQPTPAPPVPQPAPPPGAGAKLNVSDQWNRVSIGGHINQDALGNSFDSYPGSGYPGHFRVTQGSDNVIMEKDIPDYFWEYPYFQGTPRLTAEVWGWTPFGLAPKSYTRFSFTANQSYYDHAAPQLLIQVPGINGFGIVPAGPVQVRVSVFDDSAISNVRLHYSVADNASGGWTDAGVSTFLDGGYIFNLGQLQGTFVHLSVDAEDQYGNRIQRNTTRAFYVGQLGVQVSINAPDKVPSSGNFTAMVDINQVNNFDAANYDVSYNPAVLRLVNVTTGQLNSGGNLTAIPVDLWSANTTASGMVRIVQNVPGTSGVSGAGYLAMLQFSVVGSVGQSSNITLSNGVLSDNKAELIPAAWLGDLVQVSVVRAGDATGDGLIDARDITKVERIIAHLDPPTPGADCNGDGVINAIDITCVERKIIFGD